MHVRAYPSVGIVPLPYRFVLVSEMKVAVSHVRILQLYVHVHVWYVYGEGGGGIQHSMRIIIMYLSDS